MKNNWVHKVTGSVRVKVKGPYPELFINRCIHENIRVWDIKYPGSDVLVCSILLDEVPKLRGLAKRSNCKISFLERKGLPFLYKRMKRRSGLVIGAFLFFALLFFLSNMVWDIEIEGASPDVEHQLRQTVNELGVKKGAFQFRLPKPENIQSFVTDEIKDATWIGVTVKGTTYHFQVVEKELAEPKAAESPGHLVAKRKAVIYDMFVEDGMPVVEPNQVVEKGQLLVSGLVGKEGEEQRISAEGEVYGEFWYKAKVRLPVEREIDTVTGERYKMHKVYFGSFPLPFWGWNAPEYDEVKVEEYKTNWSIFGFDIPINYGYKEYLETERALVTGSEEELTEVAVEKGKEKLLDRFTDNAEIMGEKVLHHEVEGGKVIVTIHYRIVDEIAEKQPIIQGD
ncbi:sporulation protein YqfD [Bacillus shivajii]|uniref:sporulation protein YqfD n=1 Tax=Bacillus shivajii TaxID=1983719 RepID=UPI001CFA8A53|nr:sporulation protein YqfD [Bacillus shivajii]UCZ54499.1 sporulation protein YqfD [Bacillus shivajii]